MMYPELEKIGGPGKIPRYEDQWKDTFRSEEQTIGLEDEVEIAFGYDINKNNFTVFAGQACTVLEEFEGKDYPFNKSGESISLYYNGYVYQVQKEHITTG
jgi:hypothetical protein